MKDKLRTIGRVYLNIIYEKELAETLLNIYSLEDNLDVKQLREGDINRLYVYVRN
jgi:hypothetical protein